MIFPHQLDLFFDWLLRASWQATILIALVFLIVTLFRQRLSLRVRYALWLLVALRLLLPLAPESRFSLYNLTEEKTWSTIAGNHVTPSDTSLILHLPKPPPRDKAIPVPHTSWSTPIDWKRDFFFVWLTGVVVLCLRLVSRTWLLGFQISRFRPVIDSSVLELLEKCKEALRVRTPIFLVETPRARSVALMGFVRPRLLLPQGIFASLSRGELRDVFLHEIGHVKRGDIATNWVMHLLQILHWFNPAVWIAFARARSERELACDALVLSETGTDHKQSYGHTMLKLLQSFSASSPVALPAVVGILEYKNQIKERIHMIAQFTKKSHQWSVAAVMTAAILAVIACTNANGQNETNENVEIPPQLTITKAYWADAPDRPQAFSDNLAYMTTARSAAFADHFVHNDGAPLIWLHINVKGVENYDKGLYPFIDKVGPDFKLEVNGQPEVPVHVVKGSIGDSETLAEVMMVISPENYRTIVSGAAYSLVPDNPNPNYQWKVASGVTLVRR